MYLQFGQLSQLFGSVKDELSTLEERERVEERGRQKKGTQAEREKCCYYHDKTGQQLTA